VHLKYEDISFQIFHFILFVIYSFVICQNIMFHLCIGLFQLVPNIMKQFQDHDADTVGLVQVFQ
jgi:hypothetical protein